MKRLAAAIIGLTLLTGPAAALAAPGPESPPKPWFTLADIPGADPKIANTRWLWNREARLLRYCRQDATTHDYTCDPDVTLPRGRWVMQRIQAAPSAAVASSARFYSPDLDRTLECQATANGDFGCE
jgi:hypothetical protein